MINLKNYKNIVFFTGAGMSAESGVPTYRGSGGIWHNYNWEEYACQEAFERNPVEVLDFHELRRKTVLECQPHSGHIFISDLQKAGRRYNSMSALSQEVHTFRGNERILSFQGAT